MSRTKWKRNSFTLRQKLEIIEKLDEAPNSLNLQINKLGLQNLNETRKLTLENDPLNTLTSDDIKDRLNKDANGLQIRSTVESFQNDLEYEEIKEESNSSDNGKNMKDDEEDWGTVEKAIDEVIKFMEKSFCPLIQDVPVVLINHQLPPLNIFCPVMIIMYGCAGSFGENIKLVVNDYEDVDAILILCEYYAEKNKQPTHSIK